MIPRLSLSLLLLPLFAHSLESTRGSNDMTRTYRRKKKSESQRGLPQAVGPAAKFAAETLDAVDPGNEASKLLRSIGKEADASQSWKESDYVNPLGFPCRDLNSKFCRRRTTTTTTTAPPPFLRRRREAIKRARREQPTTAPDVVEGFPIDFIAFDDTASWDASPDSLIALSDLDNAVIADVSLKEVLQEAKDSQDNARRKLLDEPIKLKKIPPPPPAKENDEDILTGYSGTIIVNNGSPVAAALSNSLSSPASIIQSAAQSAQGVLSDSSYYRQQQLAQSRQRMGDVRKTNAQLRLAALQDARDMAVRARTQRAAILAQQRMNGSTRMFPYGGPYQYTESSPTPPRLPPANGLLGASMNDLTRKPIVLSLFEEAKSKSQGEVFNTLVQNLADVTTDQSLYDSLSRGSRTAEAVASQLDNTILPLKGSQQPPKETPPPSRLPDVYSGK